MVNSSSVACGGNENRQASCFQINKLHTGTQSSSPVTASSVAQPRTDLVNMFPKKSNAVEPTPSPTDLNAAEERKKKEDNEIRKSFFCSVPLDKVQKILSEKAVRKDSGSEVKTPRKVLCLYCDRTFVNVNLRQKHIERCHSSKHLRRVSLRKNQNCFTSTPCIYCDKFTSTEHTLKELFEHLIVNHSNKYFGCLLCEDRYFNFSHLTDHNALCHGVKIVEERKSPNSVRQKVTLSEDVSSLKVRNKVDAEPKVATINATKSLETTVEEEKKTTKNLRSRKMTVKSSKMMIKRSKRLQQTKLNEPYKKRRMKEIDKKNKTNKQEQSAKLNEKPPKNNQNSINPYPEFDHFFQVKKITDHSIDNLKISSLTFDDVFDKEFFNRIKCNIQENLLHHIDGKLFKNEASETRISNFEKVTPVSQEVQNLSSDNYGCELSLNAVTPTTSLLSSSQFGEDLESQIEYGSKASKKKTQTKQNECHYKYFTRRKYQASILEHKENRDLSKLDIWTQYLIKNRQQTILDNKKSPAEILDYFSGEEYKNKMKREELNRILDRRGPFEDLREEATKKAALDKLNGENDYSTNDDSCVEVGELLNDILDKVFELSSETSYNSSLKTDFPHEENRTAEIPSYLNLVPTSTSWSDNPIDKSDRITLICSSQETENFEHPNNTVRARNEKVELTGEWARSRIYVCAACGIKLQNLKQFLEHRSAAHQYVWVQHYEFVGNQSELYKHLSIPVLGKVGVLEEIVQCKVWKRSDARLCTKCGKQCNSLGELHRHILECGGDWTWMLARKKCKYRPFGTKSRRKRRGLVKRIYTQKTQPSEKKIYKKNFDIPRQKPSDADTIQRMLANLPPKRITRKIICLKDNFKTTRKQTKTPKQSKFKCGKLIHAKGKEQTKNNITKLKRASENKNENYRRSLRCLNKVLTSRILDTNSSLIVRRKYKKNINNRKKDINNINKKNNFYSKSLKKELTQMSKKTVKNTINALYEDQTKEEKKSTRSSPRIEKRSERTTPHLIDKMTIKRFFPVKKKTKNEEARKSDENQEKVTPTLKKTLPKEEDTYSAAKSLYLRKRKQKDESNERVVSNEPKNKKDMISKPRKPKSAKENFQAPTTNDSEQMEQQNELSESGSKETPKTDLDVEMKDETTVEIKASEMKDTTTVEMKEGKIESSTEQTAEFRSEVQSSLEPKPLEPNDIVTVSNSNDLPKPLVKNKKKIKRPSKGLNDCIAMLTSKLGKMLDDTKSISSPGQVSQDTNSKSLKSEYILKVPLFHEHFHLYSKNEQTEVLNILNRADDTSKLESQQVDAKCDNKIETVLPKPESEVDVKVDKKISVKKPINCKSTPTVVKKVRMGLTQTKKKSLKVKKILKRKQKLNMSPKIKEQNLVFKRKVRTKNVDLTEGQTASSTETFEKENFLSNAVVNNDNLSENLPCAGEKRHEPDSEDEIPLAVFLKIPRFPEDKSNSSDSCGERLSRDLLDIDEKIIDGHHDLLVVDAKITQNNEPEPSLHVVTVATESDLKEGKGTFFDKVDKISIDINKAVDAFGKTQSEPYGNEAVDVIDGKNEKLEKPVNEVEVITENIQKKLEISSKHDNFYDCNRKNGMVVKTEVVRKTVEIFEEISKSDRKNEFSVDLCDINNSDKENLIQDNVQISRNFDKPEEEKIKNHKECDSTQNYVALKPELSKNVENLTVESNEDLVTLTETTSTSVFVPKEDKVDKAESNEESSKQAAVGLSDESKDRLENSIDESNKALRRSKRNSKRITSYNEVDLIDPLLDDIEIDGSLSEIIENTSKNVYINRTKSRKKGKIESKVTKLNGEELFDLLKETSKENMLSKPPNLFFHNFDDISNDFNDDNFDVLGDLLQKSIAVIEKDLTEKTIVDTSSSFSQITENSNEAVLNSKTNTMTKKPKTTSKGKKKLKKISKHKGKLLGKEIENKLQLPNSYEDAEVCMNFLEKTDTENSNNFFNKTNQNNFNKNNYCEICDKFFCRVEGLTKHKRTLTHISKLSEIEAKEAALKSQNNAESDIPLKEDLSTTTYDSKKDLSLLNMLKSVETNESNLNSLSYNEMTGNSEIKLTDIIKDVLNKPIENNYTKNTFSNILTNHQNNNEPLSDNKRCRSLAERKSFESENCTTIIKDETKLKMKSFESEISNTAGTILERQISLLENIIENRSSVSYVDELSSTSCTLNECLSVEDEIIKYSNQNSQTRSKQAELKLNDEEGFIKPSHYEEISEDSSHRHFDDHKSRKILNRDEELFLECCSLLKSSSEVSNYSKNSAHLSKDFSNIVNKKRFNEISLAQNGYLPRKEDSSDSENSRITTLLGNHFSQEESNSISTSSNWDTKNSNVAEDIVYPNDTKSKNFSFEKMFDSIPSSDEPSSRNSLNSKDLTIDLTDEQIDRSNTYSTEADAIYMEEKSVDGFSNILMNIDNRKILTKGAMKEFEGLKVSIPTEELNMTKILTCNPPVKPPLSVNDNLIKQDETKSSPPKEKNPKSKRKQASKMSNVSKKVHDIYDFEETQDNSDIFPKPNFKSFRNHYDKNRKNFDDSDNESDNVNFDAFSSSTSSVPELVPKKSKSQQNITKKKCMIMGRIFKNAAKSRSIDENIRNIPIIDNAKLVEDFVLSCPEPISNSAETKTNMTEEELNTAFDNLLNEGAKEATGETLHKNNRKKMKSKNSKKRSHWNSDSSDDEFKVQTSGNKRVRKNNTTSGNSSCINLEQELKECIGVASRKSQRKCTSGKQNVLIEYWSSDESIIEPPIQENFIVKTDISEPVRNHEVPSESVNILAITNNKGRSTEGKKSSSTSNRRKRAAVNPLYHWSSSSEDESHDLIQIKPLRDEIDDDDDDERPVQHGWIVGDSPKKLVTMLAQAKGKKCETEGVKEHGKKRTNTVS